MATRTRTMRVTRERKRRRKKSGKKSGKKRQHVDLSILTCRFRKLNVSYFQSQHVVFCCQTNETIPIFDTPRKIREKDWKTSKFSLLRMIKRMNRREMETMEYFKYFSHSGTKKNNLLDKDLIQKSLVLLRGRFIQPCL